MIVKRYKNNPVLKPFSYDAWRSKAVFNGCPVRKEEDIYLVYRALSSNYYHTYSGKEMELSTIGVAKSSDGKNFKNQKQLIYPTEKWEKFGCEDPRITKIDDKYYIFYTSLSTFPFESKGIKIAVATSKDLKSIDEKHQVTPFNAKAMSLFPEKIKGKMWSIFTFHSDAPPVEICLAPFKKESDMWSKDYWKKWYKNHSKYSLDLKRNQNDHVEVGAQPIKTKNGWLIFYSYIKNYFSSKPEFGIEAALLDLKNPSKIIARTKGPILAPQEFYEEIGIVPNIVFPSGAIKKEDWIYLYYGAADTTTCLAFVNIPSLMDQMMQKKKLKNLSFKRSSKNPIMEPNPKNDWESKAVFNPATLLIKNEIHIVYRAMSEDNTSYMGYARSKDGVKIDYKSPKPIYGPQEDFEKKIKPNENSGCEDPRLTEIDGEIYMLYTAFNSSHPPRVALTSIKKEDFLKENWKWSKPKLISSPGADNKDAALFPEKINGEYYILHRNGDTIDLSTSKDLKFGNGNYLEEVGWVKPRKGWWDNRKIGLSCPPIKTEKGWLLIYHGVHEDGSYHLGALLLDLENPYKVLSRTDNPIFSPEKKYEKEGIVPNVVFPCGAVIKDGYLIIHYGGADKVMGVAKMKLKDLFEKLEACRTDFMN